MVVPEEEPEEEWEEEREEEEEDWEEASGRRGKRRGVRRGRRGTRRRNKKWTITQKVYLLLHYKNTCLTFYWLFIYCLQMDGGWRVGKTTNENENLNRIFHMEKDKYETRVHK